jgi:hypothetical protein
VRPIPLIATQIQCEVHGEADKWVQLNSPQSRTGAGCGYGHAPEAGRAGASTAVASCDAAEVVLYLVARKEGSMLSGPGGGIALKGCRTARRGASIPPLSNGGVARRVAVRPASCEPSCAAAHDLRVGVPRAIPRERSKTNVCRPPVGALAAAMSLT